MADTTENKRCVVECISAYQDSHKMRLITPPMRLSVSKERAEELIKAKVCIIVKK